MRTPIRTRLTAGSLALATLLVALLAPPAATATPPRRPNILLIVAEDMSDRVGAFGDPVAVTPNLDRLAAEGVRYPNTFTTASACATSRAALMLGMHQVSSGALHMRTSNGPRGGYMTVPPPEVKAFPETLRAAGYYTFNRLKLDYQFSRLLPGSGPFSIWDMEYGYTDLAPLREWRHRAKDQPFFGNYNLIVTHESGLYPQLGNTPDSFGHFEMQVYRTLLFGWVSGPIEADQVKVEAYYPDTPTVRATLAKHYNNIRYMDAEVGEILDDLEADDVLDDTVVIWTTDHGDGLPRGKRDLYDRGIRVPMIIRWPERFRPPGIRPGDVDRRLISFIDITSTILALARIQPPNYMHGRDIRTSNRRYVFASNDRIDRVRDRQRAVRDKRYKYIRSWYPKQIGAHPSPHRDPIPLIKELRRMYESGELNAAQSLWFQPNGRDRLYDLQEDPNELRNLADDPQHADTLARLQAVLEQRMTEIGDMGDESEDDLAQRFWPGGIQPQTPTPIITAEGNLIAITCKEAGASIGYRVDGDDWQLYTEPVLVKHGQAVFAKAVRYGWAESAVVTRAP